MRTLICGSIAYDTIMVFEGRFRDRILPDQVHILNVSFLVPELRRDFGGVGANIAYNLRLLGGEPVLMGTVGDDAAPYLERMHALGIATDHVRMMPGTFTAQAFMTTDLDDNQISAFHPGAMNFAQDNHVVDAGDIGLGIVAPDGRAAMIQHASEFAAAGIAFVFDPGQGLPMFDGPELMKFVDQAQYVAVNDYEAKLLQDRTGRTPESFAQDGKVVIVTLGSQGCIVHEGGKTHQIGAAKVTQVVDPTGAGDAYRAGLLYGISNQMDWPTTARLANTMGALKVASGGPQNHAPSREQIAELFQHTYAYRPW